MEGKGAEMKRKRTPFTGYYPPTPSAAKVLLVVGTVVVVAIFADD